MDTASPHPVSASVNPRVEALQKKAFIFAIISIATFWFPLVGLGFGIAGIACAVKARRQSIASEQPPRQFAKELALSITGTVVGACMVIATAAILTLAISVLSNFIVGSSSSLTSYSSTIEAFGAARKDFSSNETIEYGPYDLTISDIQKDYSLTSEEAPVIQGLIQDARRDAYHSDHNTYGQDAPEDKMVYTKFTIDLAHNSTRAELYNRISMDIPSWGQALGQLKVDGKECISRSATTKELRKYDHAFTDEHTEPTSITYICIGENPEPSLLTLEVSAFARVSAIVGTEGMPRKDFGYSVTF